MRGAFLAPALIIVLVAMALAGCAGTGPSLTGMPSGAEVTSGLITVTQLPGPADGLVISPVVRVGDTVKLAVFGVDNLNQSAAVDGAGNVTLQLVGPVFVLGKTLDEVEATITDLYGSKYLQDPQITVTLEQTVTMDGEFAKPGAYPLAPGASLLRLVAIAGNFTGIGDPASVYVFRSSGGRDYVAQYNVEQIRAGKAADVSLFGGDVVVAFPSGMRVFGRNLTEAFSVARGATGIL